MDQRQNPFNITKAVDFSDREIVEFWVDMPQSGFAALAKPTSHMPMFILGGKGSGKTHIMRYYAHEARRERARNEGLVEQVAADGFLGLYFRCRGLNAHRFSGKGQSIEVWDQVFVFYMDLWLSRLLLHTVSNLFEGSEELAGAESSIVTEIGNLLVENEEWSSLADVVCSIDGMRKVFDREINNCAITKSLTAVRITANPGDLVFGLPRILAQRLPSLASVVFVYLIDELENLTERQQRYVNTLVREKEPPASFKIGSRLYGWRTAGTLSADEENKEGSEFETLRLDDHLRHHRRGYRAFCERLVTRRLVEAGYVPGLEESSSLETVAGFFEHLPEGRGDAYFSYFDQLLVDVLTQGNRRDERPYRSKFRRKLGRCSDADAVVELLRVDDSPFLERINIFSFYKLMRGRTTELATAERLAAECRSYREGDRKNTTQARQISKFGRDILAQLMRECERRPQLYVGFDDFVNMSDGLPRNLLVILKNIFKWAVFNGEEPFSKKHISFESQLAGVKQASEWFYHDARIAGPTGDHVRKGVWRLATLLREIRYSDRPPECSCVSFNGDLSGTSSACRRVIEAATQWSMLVADDERRDKNSRATLSKYRLSPMLAPMWDLPLFSRGSLTLSSEEINSLFDPDCQEFEGVMKRRIARMTYLGRKDSRDSEFDKLGLFGTTDD